MATVTITKSVKSPKGIFYAGNYVVTREGNQVVLVTAQGDWESVFSGITIYHEKKHFEGLYSTSYGKEAFVQFVGTITITSE